MNSPDLEKWRFLERVPLQDSQHPKVRAMAADLMRAALGSPRVFAMLCAARCREGIRFVRDTGRVGHEDIAGYTRAPRPDDAIDALERGADDCDAKARAFCALCLAGGLRARMMPLWDETDEGTILAHVYAAVSVDGRNWIPCELTLTRARIGDWPKEVPREKDGKWSRT